MEAIVFLVVTGVSIGGAVLWVSALLSVARYSDFAWDAVRRSRAATTVLIALTGVLGAVYYMALIRPQLEAAAHPGSSARAAQ